MGFLSFSRPGRRNGFQRCCRAILYDMRAIATHQELPVSPVENQGMGAIRIDLNVWTLFFLKYHLVAAIRLYMNVSVAVSMDDGMGAISVDLDFYPLCLGGLKGKKEEEGKNKGFHKQ